MQDPYETLNLPRRFDLDEAQLHARFIEASSACHPDRHTDPVAQAEAAEQAAIVNQAYATLANPESRADALLILLGGPAKGDDKSLPPDLLMEMMEIREQMEEAVAANDTPALDKLRGWADEERRTHLIKVADLFDTAGDTLPADQAKAIRIKLNTLRYIERMLEQMPGA